MVGPVPRRSGALQFDSMELSDSSEAESCASYSRALSSAPRPVSWRRKPGADDEMLLWCCGRDEASAALAATAAAAATSRSEAFRSTGAGGGGGGGGTSSCAGGGGGGGGTLYVARWASVGAGAARRAHLSCRSCRLTLISQLALVCTRPLTATR
jgi:hypothetical protein